MAGQPPQTLEQFKARMDCRTGIQMRVAGFKDVATQESGLRNESLLRDCGSSGVKGRISNWSDRETDYSRKSRNNVFSDRYTQGLNVSDAEYGTPEAGSRTDQRGRQAGARISNEVVELCQIIAEMGQNVGPNTWCISFGLLFETYTRISNKVVGMLMRARRQHLVDFEGEMLFQGRDDDVVITLLKDPNEIENVESIRQHVVRRN